MSAKKASDSILIDGHSLSIQQIVSAARDHQPAAISDNARTEITRSAEAVASIVESDEPVYGINTGFGIFSNRRIDSEQRQSLSHNLVQSHAVGLGEPFPIDVTRAAMLIRANSLAHGYSGIRLQLIECLIQMLNKDVVPLIPSQGSLGSSGDLAALAHLALVLSKAIPPNHETIPLVHYQNKMLPADKAMQQARIDRHDLGPKEGLALINGATFSAALLSLACHDSQILLNTALGAAALSLEALLAVPAAFDARLHEARPHPGQIKIAAAIRGLTEGSQLLGSSERVQDAYSLRCIPQVLGPVLETLDFVARTTEVEVNAATDNPLIFDQIALSGGNFHGQPIGLASDYLKIALSEVGAIAERRIFRLLDPTANLGLPAMLVPDKDLEGLHSGLMMLQYTAASLVLENLSLASPDSIHSLPTSAGQEDHNANATTGARRLAQVVNNVRNILAIELLVASQAVELRLISQPNLRLGNGTERIYQAVRHQVPLIDHDQTMTTFVETLNQMIARGEFSALVEPLLAGTS